MELLSHTLRHLAKAPVSALLVHKVGIFCSKTQSNTDQTDCIDNGRDINIRVSEFRAADSQHLIRLREIVSDGF